jgi:hypothetical protein
MFAQERHNSIRKIVREKQRLSFAELQNLFRVSPATLRRDLSELEREGDLIRVHGGVLDPLYARAEISFDERSKTESGNDYVRFHLPDSKKVGDDKYTGRGDSARWAGVGGHPPLVVEGGDLEARFHSDGSDNDWGYKFTATPCFATHWIQYDSVSENLLSLLNGAVASLLKNDVSFVVPHSCYEMLLCDGSIPVLSSPSKSSEPTEASFCVDAKDKVGKWYQAFIVNGSVLGDCESENVTIHFMGWDSKWDEVFPRSKYDTHIRHRTSCPVGPNGPETIEDVLKKYPATIFHACIHSLFRNGFLALAHGNVVKFAIRNRIAFANQQWLKIVHASSAGKKVEKQNGARACLFVRLGDIEGRLLNVTKTHHLVDVFSQSARNSVWTKSA